MPGSSDSSASIDLAPRASLRAIQVLLVLHMALIALLPFAMEQGPWMVAVAALFGLSWLALRRHPAFGYGPRALTRLTLHGDGTWTVYNAAGSSSAGLLPSSYVHPLLMVLNFRTETGQRRTRVLVGDELPAEQLRALRARLMT